MGGTSPHTDLGASKKRNSKKGVIITHRTRLRNHRTLHGVKSAFQHKFSLALIPCLYSALWDIKPRAKVSEALQCQEMNLRKEDQVKFRRFYAIQIMLAWDMLHLITWGLVINIKGPHLLIETEYEEYTNTLIIRLANKLINGVWLDIRGGALDFKRF